MGVSETFASKSSSRLSEKECRKLLIDDLGENGCTTRSEYSRIKGKLKNKAPDDLKRFAEQELIRRKEKRNTLVFVPAV